MPQHYFSNCYSAGLPGKTSSDSPLALLLLYARSDCRIRFRVHLAQSFTVASAFRLVTRFRASKSIRDGLNRPSLMQSLFHKKIGNRHQLIILNGINEIAYYVRSSLLVLSIRKSMRTPLWVTIFQHLLIGPFPWIKEREYIFRQQIVIVWAFYPSLLELL